jgi:hypothetical protein
MPKTPTNNDHIEQFAESGRQVATEATRAGAELARHGAESARQGFELGLNSTVHNFKRATDQFTQVLGFGGIGAEVIAEH